MINSFCVNMFKKLIWKSGVKIETHHKIEIFLLTGTLNLILIFIESQNLSNLKIFISLDSFIDEIACEWLNNVIV